jgi:serine/threonine protein kinase
MEPLQTLQDKLRLCNTIKRSLYKKRIVLDENVDKFGCTELTQLTKVKNTSEIKGYPFKGRIKSVKIPIGIKVVPNETKYDKKEHPSYLEFMFLKMLTEDVLEKNVSPHITYYLGQQKVSNRCRALKVLNLKRLEVEEKIRSNSHILLSEYVDGGSLDNWIYNLYEADHEVSDIQWKGIVFQLLYTISVLQEKYRMMHNDFHYGNILMDTSIQKGGYFVYKWKGKTFYVPNSGFIPKLWDFEFSMVYDPKSNFYPNKFVFGAHDFDTKTQTARALYSDDDDAQNNVPISYNEVYDVHYFLTSLLDLYISQEVFDWILSLYPKELIPPDENTSSHDAANTTEGSEGTKRTQSTAGTAGTKGTEDAGTECTSYSSHTSDPTSTTATHSSRSSTETSQSPLLDGRLINGVEATYEHLPTPSNLLRSEFFSLFTKKPEDFDEKNSMVFELK